VSSDGGERVRLFVALDLPEHVRTHFVRWCAPMVRQTGQLRAVAAEGLHVTLCFLGARPAGEIAPIASACAAALADNTVQEVSVEAGMWLPARHPRVLAIRLADPSGGLARAQHAISEALCAGGWYTPEKRPFLPHVTVARVAAGARLRPPELSPPPALSFRAPAVTLYRSRLQRSGARYEPLATLPLVPAG
jgi:2'-5' RNA ligase